MEDSEVTGADGKKYTFTTNVVQKNGQWAMIHSIWFVEGGKRKEIFALTETAQGKDSIDRQIEICRGQGLHHQDE